ncbi:MAG: helix-turn-helix domain-containing protein [Bacteroidales bacterium]|nr:helix-turn-helix domain-containing protein [Bacteroidales bacterium]
MLKNKDFLSISEISQLFGVSRTTIWRLCKYDKLKSVKIGKSRFISRKQLEFLFSTDDELETIQPYAKEVVYKEEDYYSVLEIQEKYNMSQSAVYNLVKRNNLSKITIWKNIFIPKTEIEAVFS